MTRAQTGVSFLKCQICVCSCIGVCMYTKKTELWYLRKAWHEQDKCSETYFSLLLIKKKTSEQWTACYFEANKPTQRGKSPLSHTFPSARDWPPVFVTLSKDGKRGSRTGRQNLTPFHDKTHRSAVTYWYSNFVWFGIKTEKIIVTQTAFCTRKVNRVNSLNKVFVFFSMCIYDTW